MPQVSNVTLTGTAPASVTYSVASRGYDETNFADRRRLIPALFGTYKKTVKLIRDVNRKLTGSYRVTGKITEPVIRLVDGVDAVIDNCIINIECRMAGDATLAEKQHAIKLAVSLLQHASFTSSVETGEADY